MVQKNGLSIEIFRDYHSINPDALSIDPLLSSVQGLGRIVGKFDIIDTSKFLDLSTRATKRINMDNILLSVDKQSADLNVVLTDRRLTHENRLLRGVAQTLPNKPLLGTRIAIVSTYKNDLLTATAGHEIGHNLNLAHCSNEECTMSIDCINQDEEHTDIYCGQCMNHVHKNINLLQRAKVGKKVSQKALFPTFYKQFPDGLSFV